MGDSAPIMISTSYAMPAKRFISQGEMSVSFLGGFSAPVGARSETARPPILAGSTLCAPREKLEGREAGGRRLGSDEVAQKRGQFPEIVESHKLVRGGAPVGPSRAISERADRAC